MNESKMFGSEQPPQTIQEKPKEKSAEEIDNIMQNAQNALENLIIEDKDLNNVARYIVLRPLRRIASSNPLDTDKIVEESVDCIAKFCEAIGENYPKTILEKEALLARLNNPEIRQKIAYSV